jgi:hypothetical protein
MRRDAGNYVVFAETHAYALEAADTYLKCDSRPCLIDTGGVLLEVNIPEE